MKVLDICQRALSKIGVLSIGDDAQSEDADEALMAYNDMVAAWKLFGADTGYVEATLQTTFPLGAEFVEGTVYMLATRLSPNYQKPIQFNEARWMRALQAKYMVIDKQTLPVFRRQVVGYPL
jgi:hypothetical protein